MKQIELTKTFMMVSNWKNPLVSMVYTKYVESFIYFIEYMHLWDEGLKGLNWDNFNYFSTNLYAEHYITTVQ